MADQNPAQQEREEKNCSAGKPSPISSRPKVLPGGAWLPQGLLVYLTYYPIGEVAVYHSGQPKNFYDRWKNRYSFTQPSKP
jgi:hypothetical protein